MAMETREVRAYSPGRVNLIGDHTDYNEGVAVPMAIDLGTTVTFVPDGSRRVCLHSAATPEPAEVDLYVRLDTERLKTIEPRSARYVAAVVAAVGPRTGGCGNVESTLPMDAGLSSSASLEVALALALGSEAEPLHLAETCQRAEQAATGVDCGLMDQLVVTAAVEDCALLVDFADLSARSGAHPGAARGNRGAQRREPHAGTFPVQHPARQCEAAAYGMGPLGRLRPEDLVGISDPLLRRRARHVVTECDRVRRFASALEHADLGEAGRLMTASHRSLAQDFEASTPALDGLVEHLLSLPGVFGARLTGAGFGGCVVALTEPGAVDTGTLRAPAWRVRPSGGARLLP